MKYLITLLITGTLSLGVTQSASAALMGTYNFTSGSSAVPSYSGMTFGSFSRSTVTAVSASGVFRSANWPTTSTENLNAYVQFVLTPNSGSQLKLEQVVFDVLRSDSPGVNHGPYNGEARIFLGNNPAATATPQASQTWSLNPSRSATVTFNFSDFTAAANQAVTVRFYGWNDRGSSEYLQFDNVAVYGSVLTPVPEPVNIALGLFAGVLVVGGVTRSRQVRFRFCHLRKAVSDWLDAA